MFNERETELSGCSGALVLGRRAGAGEVRALGGDGAPDLNLAFFAALS